MAAAIIDGRKLAARVRAEVAAAAAALAQRGVKPGLAVVLVGDDPASLVYTRSKSRASQEVGLAAFDHQLPASTSQSELLELVARLNADSAVDGILVQLPLPRHIDTERVIESVSPDKDVDGFHPINVGRLWSGRPHFVPCTPLGVMRLLAESGVALDGADAVVLGRSNIVGKPVSALLLQANATVTLCHSHTRHLEERVRRADVVVAALGRPQLVRGEWIKPGATIIDVGINRVDGKLLGDVEFAAACERARAITPVPGGVGPMTIAMLLENTVRAAERRRSS